MRARRRIRLPPQTRVPRAIPLLPTRPLPPNHPTPASTPTIASDQLDYFAGSTVTLTGSGWLAGEGVNIVVNDDVGDSWRRDVVVTADSNGDITDQFVLPDWFVATYRVRATGLTSGGFAETTFTDGSIGLSATQGETASPPGTPTGTYVNGNVTTYREGDRINFRFIATNSGTASDGSIEIEYSKDAGCDPFFLSPFTLGTHNGSHPVTEPLIGTPGLTVSLVGTPTVSASDWNQRLRFQFTGAGSARVYFYLQLSGEAGQCSGASAHYGFDNSSEQGDMANTSTNAVSVPAERRHRARQRHSHQADRPQRRRRHHRRRRARHGR